MRSSAIIGAILAGGRSRRMRRPKHTLRLPDGRTMIDAVADALRATCGRVVVVGDVDEADVLPDLQRVVDHPPGRGPVAGIEALLASGLGDRYLVCPCDVPRLTSPLLARLRDATDSAPAVVFHVEGREPFEPLPLRIEASVLPVVREVLASDRPSVQRVVERAGARAVALSANDAALLVNVNTPDEFERLHHA